MYNYLIYFFMGISLSMDAFSIAISIGTTSPKKRIIQKTSIIVGIFHFIMPQIGFQLSKILPIQYIKNTNYITSLILALLAIEMIKDKNKKEIPILNSMKNILLLAFSVSVDSLTVGFVYGLNNENRFLSSILFMIVSYIFTNLGLNLGKKLKDKYQNIATIIGIILMIMISIKYLIIK